MRARIFLGGMLFFVVFSGCLLLFSAGASASRTEPVYNVVNHPVPLPAQKLPLDQIGHIVVDSAIQYHWRIVPVGPNQLRATYDRGRHEAVIDITYSQTAYSINLVSTVDLKQRDGEIHSRYNGWIHNLERTIEDRLLAAAIK